MDAEKNNALSLRVLTVSVGLYVSLLLRVSHCISVSGSLSASLDLSLSLSVSLGLCGSLSLWIFHCLPGSLFESLIVSLGLLLSLGFLCLCGSLPVSLGPSLSLIAPGLCLRAETACGSEGDREQRGSGPSRQERVFVQGTALIPWPRGHRRNPGLGNEPPHTPLAKHTPALAPAVNI